MRKNFNSYLRTHRRQHSLSQQDLGCLLGYKDASVVSLLECENREPRLKTAIALEILFGVAIVDLFPALHRKAKTDVFARSMELYEVLQGNSSKVTRLKLDFFEEALRRMEGDSRKSAV